MLIHFFPNHDAGVPEAGRQWCETIHFPAELLYLDTSSDRQLYKQLELKNGLFSFWSPAATAVSRLL